MGLFLGLGLLGAAFVVDDIQNGGYQRTIRALERKYGNPTMEQYKRCSELRKCVLDCRPFEDDKEPIISGKAIQKLIRAYDAAGVPMPAESVIRDICVLAARNHGFVYAGFTFHTYFKGPIKDPSNVVHFGIVNL